MTRSFPLWPTLGTALVVVAAAFVTGIIAGIPAVIVFGSPKNPGDIGANIIEAAFYLGGAAVLLPLLQAVSGRSLTGLGVRPLDARGWGFAAGGLAIVLALQLLYQGVLSFFHQGNHVQAGFQNFHVSGADAAVLVLVNGAIIGPIVEELFFRGLLFNAFSVRMPMLAAALLSGAIFGIAHGDPVLFPVLALFGMVQAAFYRISGNLVVPMIVHGVNNAIFLSLMIAVPGFH